jgi:hypothetical protein
MLDGNLIILFSGSTVTNILIKTLFFCFITERAIKGKDYILKKCQKKKDVPRLGKLIF